MEITMAEVEIGIDSIPCARRHIHRYRESYGETVSFVNPISVPTLDFIRI